MSEWIKVSDELPESDKHVLALQRNRIQFMQYLPACTCELKWHGGDPLGLPPTHWMPLPSPPIVPDPPAASSAEGSDKP